MAKPPIKVRPIPPGMVKSMQKKGILRKKKKLLPNLQDD